MNMSIPARWSFLKRIWIGPEGLRAGWAILLFFAIATGAFASIGAFAEAIHHPLGSNGPLVPLGAMSGGAVQCVAVLVATWVMGMIDKRSWLSYGLKMPRAAAHFWQGALWGVVVLSAMMIFLDLIHAVTIRYSGADALPLFESGLLWAVAFFLVAASEELAFRGYAFFKLLRGCENPLFAAILMSLLFGGVHLLNSGESLVGAAQVVAFGLVCCLAVWRTGSLWWVFGLHAAWDWSETFLFGTADSGLTATGHLLTTHATGPAWLSGGLVGPEGSVLVFPAMAVLAILAISALPRMTRDVRRGPGNQVVTAAPGRLDS
ncbi:MAG TPA: type II CAAX endopeptidase family protein [Rhodanobacteraceae bacterium]|nr:type II CAAX endopeptidase family protein [Rhodanobacteraceae bacterium]